MTDEFDYELSDELVAKSGAEPRDSARLLVDGGERVDHLHIADIPDLVGPGDVVVVNDSRVLHSRLRFHRPTGGASELLLLEEIEPGRWEALAKPSGKMRSGECYDIAPGLSVTMGADLGDGRREITVEADAPIEQLLDRLGDVPLPPYLGDVVLADDERYQTVYSDRASSAAAPTAGLHFTQELLDEVESAGAEIETVELTIGLSTFRPIATDSIDEHRMHSERYEIEPAAWDRIVAARRVIAVGTTSVRALESAALTGALSGRTDLFIRRGFEFRVVDVLMTNFHLPRSSLLVMIDAFVGPRWRELYEIAMGERYRFLSFGDAMWLTRLRNGLPGLTHGESRGPISRTGGVA